jgi:hypothetical protein
VHQAAWCEALFLERYLSARFALPPAAARSLRLEAVANAANAAGAAGAGVGAAPAASASPTGSAPGGSGADPALAGALAAARATLALLPTLVRYRAALIVTWLSADLERSPSEEKARYLAASLPAYALMLSD